MFTLKRVGQNMHCHTPYSESVCSSSKSENSSSTVMFGSAFTVGSLFIATELSGEPTEDVAASS